MARRRHPTPEQADVTRREFMRAAACAALTTTSLVSTVWDLRMINAAAAQALNAFNPNTYKAMVCIFLSGGNDANNLLAPVLPDTRYNTYLATRGNLAIPSASLLPLSTTFTPGANYGLHPNMGELQTLFNAGKVALVANVGTLAYPTTRQQYVQKTVPLPFQLFSHSDQVIQWQTSIPDQQSRTGWGGRCADLLNSMNGLTNVSMSMSVAGANTFEVGNVVNQFNVSPGGAVSLTSLGSTQALIDARKNLMKDLLVMPHPNLNEDAFATVTSRAINGADDINNAIAPSAAANYWTVPFPNTGLGNQLKMIARLIQARSNPLLDQNRQIFFATIGGYDLHSTQTNTNNTLVGAHANLLNELSECMFAFQSAMEQLTNGTPTTPATPELLNQVVTFTMSDFSRTARSNTVGAAVPGGSDHAWGSHQIIMGGSGTGTGVVNGQRLYGSFPSLVTATFNDFSAGIVDGDNSQTASQNNGRWVPTTAVDQYSATLAKWFGVLTSDLTTVFPNLGRFSPSDMGFMNAAASIAASTPLPPTRPPSRTPTR